MLITTITETLTIITETLQGENTTRANKNSLCFIANSPYKMLHKDFVNFFYAYCIERKINQRNLH